MRVALVYDRVNKWGGAERVLLALHELFPDAPLYTSVYDQESAPWASVFPKVIPSFLQIVPGARQNHERLALFMPMAFESFNLDKYDLVISVTSEAAKGVITRPGTKHICYCLTPTRYLWSGHDNYFQNKLLKHVSRPAVSYLRQWDKHAASRPDIMIAISTAVQKRIRKYYARNSKIVFPPAASLPAEASAQEGRSFSKNANQYYLVVSRLVPYKRVDLAIEAFNDLGLSLVIVGSGSEEKRLKVMAKSNIKFTGQLTDNELASYYVGCSALIHPQEEDFGLVAVEAQMFGKPVIAYQAGGALDTVTEKTGVFFGKQNKKDLEEAIGRFNRLKFDEGEIKSNAQKFSKESFKKKFFEAVGC